MRLPAVLSTTIASWAALTTTTTTVSAIDCGCPETCNYDAQIEKNGAAMMCYQRIEWLMQHRDLPEANACAAASQGFPGDPGGDADQAKPCRYEACHPVGCGSTLTYVEDFQLLHNCGCPESCTDDVMNQQFEGQQWSCLQRVHYMVHFHKNFEYDACEMAVDEGFCDAQACRPDLCGSTLPKPLPLDCGCPQSCTDAVLDEQRPDMKFSCRARLEFMIDYHKNAQWDACQMASDEGYCDTQKCRPDVCGSTLEKPENPVAAAVPPPAPEAPVPVPPPAPEEPVPPPPAPEEPVPAPEAPETPPAPEVPPPAPETPPEDNTDQVENELVGGINSEIQQQETKKEKKHTGAGIFSHPTETTSEESAGGGNEGGGESLTASNPTSSESNNNNNSNNNDNNNSNINNSNNQNSGGGGGGPLPIFLSFLTGGLAAGLFFYLKSRREETLAFKRQQQQERKIWGRKNSLPCVSPRASIVDNQIAFSSYKDIPIDDDIQHNTPLWDDSIKQAQIEMKRMGVDAAPEHDYDDDLPNAASRYRDVPTSPDDVNESYDGDLSPTRSWGGGRKKKKKKKKSSSKMKKMGVGFDHSSAAADDEFPSSGLPLSSGGRGQYRDLERDAAAPVGHAHITDEDSIDLPSLS